MISVQFITPLRDVDSTLRAEGARCRNVTTLGYVAAVRTNQRPQSGARTGMGGATGVGAARRFGGFSVTLWRNQRFNVRCSKHLLNPERGQGAEPGQNSYVFVCVTSGRRVGQYRSDKLYLHNQLSG